MTKNITLRLPQELAEQAEMIAKLQGKSFNQLTIDALSAAVDHVRHDQDFVNAARKVLERDRAILERLAGQ
jgi:uncharacterized protein (DUF1778 family)